METELVPQADSSIGQRPRRVEQVGCWSGHGGEDAREPDVCLGGTRLVVAKT